MAQQIRRVHPLSRQSRQRRALTRCPNFGQWVVLSRSARPLQRAATATVTATFGCRTLYRFPSVGKHLRVGVAISSSSKKESPAPELGKDGG